MYSQTAQSQSSSNVNAIRFPFANKKSVIVEKDSGVYEPTGESYCASRRNSACSAGFPSVCSGVPTVSPNTTSSSAYSSAASTCSEIDVHRRRSGAISPFERSSTKKVQRDCIDRIPFHPIVVRNRCLDENTKTIASSSSHKCRNKAVSSLFKPDYSTLSDNGRRLYDQINNRVFEKKRLLGKVSFNELFFY